MGLVNVKWDTTHNDFECRKEKAIEMLKGTQLVSNKKNKYFITEDILRNEYEIDDGDACDARNDTMFFDGNFVIFPDEKILVV